jgi:hypothetical protein
LDCLLITGTILAADCCPRAGEKQIQVGMIKKKANTTAKKQILPCAQGDDFYSWLGFVLAHL